MAGELSAVGIADDLVRSSTAAGYDVRPIDPAASADVVGVHLLGELVEVVSTVADSPTA